MRRIAFKNIPEYSGNFNSFNLEKQQQQLENNQNQLKTSQAALFIGCASSTLKLSRHTGILFGVPSPEYIKRGRSVVYNKSTLDKWLSQFCEQQNTSSGEC